MKSEYQIQFQQSCLTLDKQFQLAETQRIKLTSQKLEHYSTQIKKLSSVLQRIQSKLKSSLKMHKNTDQYDVKDKIRKYKEKFDKLFDRYKYIDSIYLKIAKQDLIKHRTEGIQMDDLSLLKQNRDMLLGVQKDAYETEGIVNNNYSQLMRHNQIIDRIQSEQKQFQQQLSITDQLMRVLTNRNLITKLILILLVFFLGLSDIIILFLKIV